MRHFKSLVAAVAMTGLLATMVAADHHQKQMQPPEVGKPAPSFELQDLSGKTHQLSDFEGQIVVLHFQQIGCPWEANYQSYFNELSKQYGGENQKARVQFLAINSNRTESVEELKQYQAGELSNDATAGEHPPVAYPVLKDPGNKVADKYAAATTPHIYVIDEDGTLRYRGGVEAPPGSLNQATRMDQQYLRPVLEALGQGSEIPVKQVTKSKGCGIKRVQ